MNFCIPEMEMSKLFKDNKFRLGLLLLLSVIIIIAGISIYKSKNTKLIDKEDYSAFKTAINDIAASEASGFTDQQELMAFIESWADERGLKYKEDKFGNIIFNKSAIKRKKNVTPTLIAVSMNYETAAAEADRKFNWSALRLTFSCK